MEQKVMAMYDVRGIQKYIFRTAKVKDAIGASAIVETIIQDALEYAVDRLCIREEAELEWCTEEGAKEYRANEKKVQVLYIGGGNAYIACESGQLCRKINRIMAKYTIEKTYSLQLAAAMVNITGDYQEDYKNLMEEMNRVKANMTVSKPLGALPVMEIEVKTGYPVAEVVEKEKLSTESLLKKQKGDEVRKGVEKQVKILDNYTTQKGLDSMIAVVHIDGNNMGLRIRDLISGLSNYEEAVNRMREISFYINSSYKNTFERMKKYFNENAGQHEIYDNKKTDYFVLKILVAGDDITYVCNGKIALATVEYYCREIARHTMTGKRDPESIRRYGFSVCAGIAYIGSHFPFYAGYAVAEACCDNAKEYAKRPEHRDEDRIGNWVDFQICKNIQAQNLKEMRRKEYETSYGEKLLRRPYFVTTDADGALKMLSTGSHAMDHLKRYILYFQNDGNMPRSFAKNLRNIYSQGAMQVQMFYAFLESRGWKMPDDTDEFYEKNMTAKWYDALEMMDYYIDLDTMKGEKKHE